MLFRYVCTCFRTVYAAIVESVKTFRLDAKFAALRRRLAMSLQLARLEIDSSRSFIL